MMTTQWATSELFALLSPEVQGQMIERLGSQQKVCDYANEHFSSWSEAAGELNCQSQATKQAHAKIRSEIQQSFDLLTVNGVVYSTEEQASKVRAALIAEGIGHHYPGTKEATRAIKKHGAE